MVTAFLIRWVMLGTLHTISVEAVPSQLCEAMSVEAVRDSDTVRAAVCVRDGRDIVEALRVGECSEPTDYSTPDTQVYFCNGRLPKWK